MGFTYFSYLQPNFWFYHLELARLSVLCWDQLKIINRNGIKIDGYFGQRVFQMKSETNKLAFLELIVKEGNKITKPKIREIFQTIKVRMFDWEVRFLI